jgi:uncharacterized membrane protein
MANSFIERSDLKIQAKAMLKGKVGITFLALLVFGILSGVAGSIFGVGLLILGGPLSLGITIFFLSFVRKEEVKIGDIFKGFNNFVPALVAYILQGIFIVLWSLLLIVPGIIAGLRYAMTYYIMADNPALDGLEAIKQSKAMMKGHKGRLFVLYLSFFGWYLLIPLTLGIILIWLAPYMSTALALFYDDLKKNTQTSGETTTQA